MKDTSLGSMISLVVGDTRLSLAVELNPFLWEMTCDFEAPDDDDMVWPYGLIIFGPIGIEWDFTDVP